MHNGFVHVDNEKMSKSLGNFFTIRDVLKKFDARSRALLHPARALPQPVQLSATRIWTTRGRADAACTPRWTASMPAGAGAPIDWTEAARARASPTAMNDDFNTPGALAVLFELANELNRTQVGRAGARS